MSTPNPIEVAAAPSLIAALQAIKQFNADMGVDPTHWAVNFPGAQLKLTGTLQLLLPGLLVSEASAAQAAVNNQLDSWIAKLQALTPK